MPVKTQKTYAETIIPKAVEAYAGWPDAQKLQDEMFANIIRGDVGLLAEPFPHINDAAEDAIHDNGYLGTLHLVPGAAPVWLDLTDHGLALSVEREMDAAAEDEHKYAGGDGCNAGRTL